MAPEQSSYVSAEVGSPKPIHPDIMADSMLIAGVESIRKDAIRNHEQIGMTFATISALFTAAAFAYPVFAIPAITYWIGAAREFLNVPSMNPPEQS